eukprot:TRINITY_DN29773_c0_g1_i1.p1 TRINITY_DN29773_c0_g1~~TRINITY_DN29773_c0_g1_i1.p1  ORF type:complete len:143 (+),score=27.22 TRINITY_DN29773_c0_g1_i1:2-430(+)
MPSLVGSEMCIRDRYRIKNYKGVFRTLKTIVSEEGFKGCYQGYKVTAISIPLFHSLYFSIYGTMKPWAHSLLQRDNHVGGNMLAAGVTGTICNFLTHPLWVLRTRFQTQFLHDPLMARRGISIARMANDILGRVRDKSFDLC